MIFGTTHDIIIISKCIIMYITVTERKRYEGETKKGKMKVLCRLDSVAYSSLLVMCNRNIVFLPELDWSTSLPIPVPCHGLAVPFKVSTN